MARKRRKSYARVEVIGVVVLFLTMLVIGIHVIRKQFFDVKALVQEQKLSYKEQPELDVELLTVNPYSRPGIALEKVKGIVVHYTANPGSSAVANRNYFEGLKDSHITKASSHFVIGTEGEIVQCIPTAEISYASNQRNVDTISIECCHMDKTGKFTKKTYRSLIRLLAYLMGRFSLSTDDIIRHYDVTGKNCPKYYVEHPEAWKKLKTDTNRFILENGE
ncbi:N-acetylmuramoyl-L-alanine amidase [Lachnospiraceae bacterium XBB1006]|nr:N-acetylmuramoyl-L-alanine amidase [Lachnospiraceae bacterium XBB1006]